MSRLGRMVTAMLMFFPVIGLFMSTLAAGFANHPPEVRSPGPALAMTSGE